MDTAESTGTTVVRKISKFRHRKDAHPRSALPRPTESFDERYEMVDAGAFWDETAEVLAPPVTASG